jgi:hypothetical protein
MEEQTFLGWVELPEAQPVRFGDLPGLLAGALHTGEFAQSAAEISFAADLKKMVDEGELLVRDPLTLGRHTFPHGASLRRAVLLPTEDLRPLLASRSIGLRLIPNGTGPTHWTIANAASAIATQEGWHQGALDTLREQMLQAATDGNLTIRHPHTGMTYRPDRVRDFYDLVTPVDVNAWLARASKASMVWRQGVSVPPPAADTSKATAPLATKTSPAAERCEAVSGPLAGPAAAIKPVRARTTWRDVAWDYMVQRLREARFSTAVELNHALHRLAGDEGSPFDKGEGLHRGSLWVREIGKPLALKTIQNCWQELQASARTA